MAYDGTLKFDTSLDASGFKGGIDKIGKIAQTGIKATATILGGAATAVSAIGTAAVKVGSDFEATMSKVEAISGASGDDLEALTAKAKEMGAATKFSATESANAFEYMAMAGWKTGDMLNGIEGIMNLAAASGEDLATTSDIVTDALTAFGLTAADSTHFADVLAQASSNANTNVGMMGETFKYVAPVAGALGYSAEDTATAIGLMANAGIKASQAGTSLRTIMSRLAKPTNEVQMAMDALGISLTDNEGNMKSLSEMMGDLRKGFSGLSEAEAAQMAAALGGQEAMSGLLAIVNASDDDFDKLQSAIYSCDGAAAQMADTMNDNLQGQLTILKSGLEGLGISLYENMQEPMKEVVATAKEMVDQLQNAFDDGGLDGLVTKAGDVFAQIVEKAATAAPKLIETASDLVKSFCDGLKSAPGIGESGASLIMSLVTGLMSCVGKIWTTATVLISKLAEGMAGALPTLIAQAASIVSDIALELVENLQVLMDAALQLVMGLVQGLVNGIPILLEGAVQLFQAIIEAIPTIIQQLLQALPDLITAIVEFLVDDQNQIVDAAVQMLNGLIDAIPVIIEAITEKLPQIITALVNGLVDALPQLLEASITLLMAIVQAIPDIVAAIAENLPQIITAISTGLAQAIPTIFVAARNLLWQIIKTVPEIVIGIAGVIPDIIAGIVKGLIGGIGAVKDAALELCSGILNGIKSFFGIHSPSTVMEEQGDFLVLGMINGLSSLPEKALEIFTNVLADLITWGADMLTNAIQIATDVVNSATEWFSQLPGKIWIWLTDTITKVKQWGANLFSTASTAASNTINKVVEWFSRLPGKIWIWLTDTITKVTQWGTDLVSKATTAASNAVNAVVEWFSQLPGKIWTWLTNTIAKVTQFASDLKAKATDAAQGFVTNLVDGVKDLPDKFREIGANIVTGIWDGISSGWDWLTNKVSNLANSLFEAAKDALGIHSPSIVFAQEVGRWIPPGIGIGIDSAMPDLEEKMGTEMDRLVQKMQTAVEIETGNITVKSKSRAEHEADTEYQRGGDTYVDQHIEQENNYHVPVATPSETSKANREAARKLLGGVK